MKYLSLVLLAVLLFSCGPSQQETESQWNEKTNQLKTLYEKEEYQQLLKLAEERVGIADEQFEGKYEQANAYNDLALVYTEFGYYGKAEEMYEKAFNIGVGQGKGLARTYENMALLYKCTKRYDQAVEYGQKALEEYQKEQPVDSTQILKVKLDLLRSLAYKRDFLTATQLMNEITPSIKKTTDSHIQLSFVRSLADIVLYSLDTTLYDRTLRALETAKRFYEKEGALNDLSSAYDQAGTIYTLKEQYDLAIENENKSIKYKLKAYQDSTTVSMSMKNLSLVYKLKGDSTTSNYYMRLYERLSQSQ